MLTKKLTILGENKKMSKKKENISLSSNVNSTVIDNLEYDMDRKILTVKLNSGTIANYANVSLKDYDALRTAKSVGTHYNTIFKKIYTMIK